MTKQVIKIDQPMIGLFPLTVVMATCIDQNNRPNIISIGWIGGASSNPPQVALGIRPQRYSYSLIKSTKEFVINIPTVDMIRETDFCGIVSGRRIDKFKECNLTPMKAEVVKPPLIKECPVNLECKLKQISPLGSHSLFIGEVVAVHADEEIIDKNSKWKIDFLKIKPMVLNMYEYWSLGEKIGMAFEEGKKVKEGMEV